MVIDCLSRSTFWTIIRQVVVYVFVVRDSVDRDPLGAEELRKEFRRREKERKPPSLIMMLLPCNHTEGTSPDCPPPRAQVADNALFFFFFKQKTAYEI